MDNSPNPLARGISKPIIPPKPVSKLQQDVEDLKQDRRSVGRLVNRNETFVIDLDAELMTLGAATAPLTGTGIFLGVDGANYEFRAGNPAGDYIHWDGSTLSIVGDVSVGAGSDIGGWTITATTIESGNVTLDSSAERILMGAASAPMTGVGIFLGLDGAVYEFRAGNPAGEYIHWDGTSLNIVGDVTLGTGSDVGGWSITANTIESGSIELNSSTERILIGSATAPLTGTGIFLGLDGAAYEFRVGNPAGEYLHWDGSALYINGEIGGNVFSGSAPVFNEAIELRGGDGEARIVLSAQTSGGYAAWYYNPAGAPANQVLGTIIAFENVGWDEFKIDSGDRLRLVAGEDITLEPTGDVDFQCSTTTGRSATSDYMRIKINGTTRYLLLYS